MSASPEGMPTPPAGTTGDPGRRDGDRPERTARGGTLFVVSTPIGNLGDITLRALETLSSAAVIAAEDTRHARRLLDRHGISARLLSYHARSAPGRMEAILERLRAGEDVALITDAGTPGISDPGEHLVTAWGGEDGRVVPLPGASAVLAAVAASGIAGPRWSFEGFLPRSGRERRERLARIAADPRGSVIYEAPSRVGATLDDLVSACGGERPAAVCRELTKLHEEIRRASLSGLAEAIHSGAIPARGEFAIVVGAVPEPRRTPDGAGDRSAGAIGPGRPESGAALAAARAEVDALAAGGLARGDAARRVAARTGLPRRQLYGGGAER